MAILIFLGIGWQFAFEQWGSWSGSGTEVTCYLPIAFSTGLLSVVGNDGATGSLTYAFIPINTQTVKVNVNTSNAWGMRFIAIGI